MLTIGDACTHATFTDALTHMSVGGGIAVAAIAAACASAAWAFFRYF